MGACRVVIKNKIYQPEILKIRYNVRGVLRDFKTGEITGIFEGKNLVVDSGLESIASRLSGVSNPANKGTITYCAVGTGTDAPAAADTTLQTETFRKQVSVRDYEDNVARFRTYFNTSEANATLREVGLFGDGASATTDSGTLFCRLSINKEKTDSESLTLDWEVQVSAS